MTESGSLNVSLDDFWSQEALRLKNASLSGLVGKFAGVPDVVALHAGLPPPTSFPVSGLHLDVLPTAPDGHPHTVHITSPDAVIAAQQYCFSAGYPPLLNWVNTTMKAAHTPPVPCTSAITSGAVHALSLATSLLCNPGDWMLMDEVTYSHALEVVFIPKGVRPLPVRMDEHGMDPVHLSQQVQRATQHLSSATPSTWSGDTLPPPSRPPRLVYLIPTGHNPTGCTLSVERKQQLYEVCRQHNLMILEDDAYWWLYWGPPQRSPASTTRSSTAHTSPPADIQQPGSGSAGPVMQLGAPGAGSHWYDQLPASFLSMDVDGRVLRVDTLAKVLGPGYRVGWVTGPPHLVDKIALAAQGSCVGTCPLAQVVVSQLLDSWGVAGWSGHLHKLRQLYQRKAQALEAAVSRHLSGLATWAGVPTAGMFMWLKLVKTDVPSTGSIEAALLAARVVAVPGDLAWADLAALQAGKRLNPPHLRLTFAFLDEAQLEEGAKRLATALRTWQVE